MFLFPFSCCFSRIFFFFFTLIPAVVSLYWNNCIKKALQKVFFSAVFLLLYFDDDLHKSNGLIVEYQKKKTNEMLKTWFYTLTSQAMFTLQVFVLLADFKHQFLHSPLKMECKLCFYYSVFTFKYLPLPLPFSRLIIYLDFNPPIDHDCYIKLNF